MNWQIPDTWLKPIFYTILPSMGAQDVTDLK